MAGATEEDAHPRVYDSSSEDGPGQGAGSKQEHEQETDDMTVSSAPIHPMPSFQGAFGESILESIEEQTSSQKRNAKLGAKARRQKMLDNEEYDETYNAQWRTKPQARFHPLWKLIAQISFGVHLLQKRLAKSNEEVVKILQKHVDEVDTFLERTTEDFDLSHQDIVERTNHLKLPLQHINIFDIMLDDRKFRADIIEGNHKIGMIVTRTARAMNDALVDVTNGTDAVAELSSYLNSIGAPPQGSDSQVSSIYNAMRGNTEGWFRCLRRLQTKGNELGVSLTQLGTILNEMAKRADAASRRAASHHGPNAGRQSPSSPRTASPVMLAPTSRYSSAHVANTQGKPLPRPPRSGTSTPLRLETSSMISTRPESRGQSPLPSPGLHQARTHSPLAGSPRTHSPQSHSPLPHSPRPQSPVTPQRPDSAPFEGKFERVRVAPRPPIARKGSNLANVASDEAAEVLAPLRSDSDNAVGRRVSASQKAQGSTKRSSSIIKRLRRNVSKDVKADSRSSERSQPSQVTQKHERSMTSDLADLFRVTGMNESPRNSYVDGNRQSPKKTMQKSIDRGGSLLVPKNSKATPRKPSTDLRLAESPASDSAYASGESEHYLDRELEFLDLEEMGTIRHRKSLDRFLGDRSLGGSRGASPMPPRSRSPPQLRRPASPGLPRPLTPLSGDDSDDSTPRASALPPFQTSHPASPVSLIQPSVAPTPRPHSPASTLDQPRTPTQRSKFGLFPNNRPMTPSAMSYTSDTSRDASPMRVRNTSIPLSATRSALALECPAPEVARSRTYSNYSNTSSNMFKTRDFVGGATIVSNRDEKKRSGFGKLKGWVSGRRERTSSRLNQSQLT